MKHPGSPCYCPSCRSQPGFTVETALPHPCWMCGEKRSDHCYAEGKQTCRECRAEYQKTPRGQQTEKYMQEAFDRYDAWKAKQERKNG